MVFHTAGGGGGGGAWEFERGYSLYSSFVRNSGILWSFMTTVFCKQEIHEKRQYTGSCVCASKWVELALFCGY